MNTHPVVLDGYYIDTYKVSNAKYRDFMKATNRPSISGLRGRLTPESEGRVHQTNIFRHHGCGGSLMVEPSERGIRVS